MVSEKGTFSATKLLSWIMGLSSILLISSSLSLLNYHHQSPIQLVLSTDKSPNSTPENNTDLHKPLLRVYMYDLPPKFHFGMLGWEAKNDSVWPYLSEIPPYPGGLNLQHSVEYWLTLDLLRPSVSVIRVENSSDADVVFVPFFSSLSYNQGSKGKGHRDRLLQGELVKFLVGSKEWERHGGRDHLIVAHHPNSLVYGRKRLASCVFILADFGRYPAQIANVDKDVIAPYKHMVKSVDDGDSLPFDRRPILAYFRGAIHRKDGGAIRGELYRLLKNERDVHFSFGSAGLNGIRAAGRGMASSKFCLNIAGDTPSSNRLFDAISTHCIPVIISDDIELPFEDVIDYSEFCMFIGAEEAVRKGYVVDLLRSIGREKWSEMWERLRNVSRYFEYRFPPRKDDAVDMIWRAVRRKKNGAVSNLYRKKRYRYIQSQRHEISIN